MDNSIIQDHEKVFVIRDTVNEMPLWGQIEWVDCFVSAIPGIRVVYGWMAHKKRAFFANDVISTSRGPALQAVRRLQRALRRRLYLKWYREMGGWDGFVKDIVAFAECRGRALRDGTIDRFDPGPSWGYVVEPAVAESPSGICVPALRRRLRRSPSGLSIILFE